LRLPRSSGILLHPTSLPSPHGIGDLGDGADQFVDFLVSARQTLWQVLPLGPTGYGDSPYQSFSTFAGNPLLVSPDRLVADQLLAAEDLLEVPPLPESRVDYGAVIAYKQALFARMAERFRTSSGHALAGDFDRFRRKERAWLDDYALFMALKEAHGGAVWSEWEPAIARRRPSALKSWRTRLADSITQHQLLQFAFARQWQSVQKRARENGIRIVGDLPIFVAYDSADVWSHPDQFFLDERGRPTVVAGVPPDAFSSTGQLWGNPLYRWDVMADRGYDWWVDRLRHTLDHVDLLRIDHFIGLTRYWEVPATEHDAINGRWVLGPGSELLGAARETLGSLPIITEDLGLVTPEVEALRDRFELPGMKVLQFAFGGDATNPYLPHRHVPHCVVYTGTHDNDTTVGWFATAPAAERSFVQRYLARSGEDIAYDLIRVALGSVADSAIVPLQDVLGLGSEARMNLPGRPDGNWSWRFTADQLDEAHGERLGEMVELYARLPSSTTTERGPAK
jgi:4-alpha-glucanotransferase